MKKVKMILIAVMMTMIYSCSKSDQVEPISLQSSPLKRDTVINNQMPDMVTHTPFGH